MPNASPVSRTELRAQVDLYLRSLVANDPAILDVSSDFRFTENGITLMPGTGLWANATATSDSPYIVAIDESAGQAGVLVVVDDAGEVALLGARLKVQAGKLCELETMVTRRSAGIFGPEGFREPNAAYEAEIPVERRSSREELIAIVDPYFDALATAETERLKVAEGFARRENGVKVTTNEPNAAGMPPEMAQLMQMGVVEQIDNRMISFITSVPERRYPMVDEARGVVVAAVGCDIPGGLKGATLSDGSWFPFPPFAADSNSMVMLEFFHVTDGEIDQIDAVFEFFPFGLRTGWNAE